MGTSAESTQDDERAELIEQLERLHADGERQTLQALTNPGIEIPLTMQQFKVLARISIENGRVTAHQLGEQVGVSAATMSGIIDRLVDHGVARRVEDAADRRVRRLEVTDAGRKLIGNLVDAAESMRPVVLSRLELEDLRALVRGLTALHRVVTEVEPPRGEP